MKTRNQMKPLARLIAASLTVGSIAGFGAQALAQTAAGTLIKNLATVTYEDENGNSYSAQSNEAVVTVAPVYSAAVENDNNLTGAPGQTVYFPHTLSNTGNIADIFNAEATNGGVVYLDDNNNGQPDPGEAILAAGDPINIPAGEQVSLVVALAVPTNQANGTTLDTELTATSTNGATVTDTGANSDAADGTNNDTVTVSTGPVLVLNKSSIHDEATNQITYTLTVKNNGGTDAANVNIVDALPEVDTDGDGVADTQVALVPGSISANGLINTGDIVPTSAPAISESGSLLGDINFDGDTADSLTAIVAKDVTLPPNTTVTVTYTVQYQPTWAAGVDIDNTFLAFDDPNDDGNPADSTSGPNPGDIVPSNTTNDIIPQIYGVDALDTNAGAALGTNDGGDDDSAANDSQYVDVAATGAEVLFQHEITNDGNGDDVFNVGVVSDATDGFPAGTVFTYWDSTGTVQLTDTDNDGFPDTGVLAPGASETIMVKANLPAGVSGSPANGYNATLTATSAMDTGATPASDVTALKLGAITPPNVDIANVTAGQGSTVADGFNDNGLANAQDEAPVVLETGTVNSVVSFDLQLANESGNPDSFFLSSSNVPAGWDVVFKDLAGNVITTTPLVPGGGVFKYTAEVTVSSNPAEALSESDQVGAVDGYDAVNDTITALTSIDGDLDYQMNFSAESTSTPGLSDSVTNAVDIEAEREVVITPNGQNQVQPGGTVEYTHLLENNGNQVETVEMDTTNTQPGWTTVINVDTDGDGITDTVLTSALAGTTISGVDEDGNPVQIEVTDTDGDGIPELFLEPGENVNLTSTVTSPSNAPLGAVDASTISVTETDNTAITSASDQTTVMLGQVRLEKMAAIDTDCDGTPDGAGSTFAATQTTQVEPGQCVVWNLTATNEGTATVKNVIISDAPPAFTDIVTGKLKFCHGNVCTPVPASDASDSDNATYSAGLVNFFAENGASDPANAVGGELIAGEQMTGQFTVKVQ